jgi:hypothetical protein
MKEFPWMVGDDRTQGFPLSACCCIPLEAPLAYVSQPKPHVTNHYSREPSG